MCLINRLIGWSLALALFAFSHAVFASQIVLIRCEGCTTAQYRLVAESLRTGEHYLYSLSNRQVRKFVVYYDREVALWQVEEDIVGSDVAGAFAGLLEIHDKSAGTMGIQTEVDSQDLGLDGLGAATAFDVMGDANLRARLGDRMAQGDVPNLSGPINLFRSIVLATLGQGPVMIKFIIRMWDGSMVVYIWDAATDTATYQHGESRTADGQLIPESNSPEFAGRWQGSDGDLAGLLDHMRRLGVRIVRVNSDSTSMKCEWDPVETTLTCKLI